MSVLPVALLALSPQGQPMNLPITAYEMPHVGGLKEIVMGVEEKPWQRLGLFFNKPVAFNNVTTGKRTINFIEVQIGHAETLVRPVQMGGTIPAYVVEAGGLIRQELGPFKVNNTAKRWWWVTKEGKIVRDYFQVTTSSGAWTMDVRFKKDTYDLVLGTPKGETSTEGVSGFDLTKIDAMFTPMIVDGKKVISQKEFFLFDPISGVPQPWKVLLSGRFSSPNTTHKATGFIAEITGRGITRKVFISDQGDLYRVELPKERYLQWNPTKTLGG